MPRRYSLRTLFVVTLFFAVLLGGLRALGAPVVTVLFVVGFITVVGLAQALLFHGKRPRLASLLVGAVGCYSAAFAEMGIRWTLTDFCSYTALALPGFLLAGYLAGGLVAGVFLVMDKLEQRIARGQPAAEAPSADPFTAPAEQEPPTVK